MRDFKVELFRFGLSCLPKRLAIALEFRARVGYRPNLSNPQTFNEKLQYRKLHWRNSLFAPCSDKVLMRDYVAHKIGDEFLIPMVYEGHRLDGKTLEVLLQSQPRLVLKVSNDQGSVVKVNRNSPQQEKNNALAFIRSRQRTSGRFGTLRNERWYSKNAAKIIVEVDLAENDTAIEDYKIHCFPNRDGTVQQVLAVDFGRGGETRSRTFYDKDGQVLSVSSAAFVNHRLPCPLAKEVADKLFKLAAVLAQPFSYVRVDFFYVHQRIYVGELTFAPGSGFTRFSPYEADLKLGQLWQLDPAE